MDLGTEKQNSPHLNNKEKIDLKNTKKTLETHEQ